SAGYGFICGAYMPISNFSEGLQKVISFLPGTYGTSLLRNHALRGTFEEMKSQNVPENLVDGIAESIDCSPEFFRNSIEIGTMYIIMTVSVILLIGIYILINALHSKKS
ncbi:MAG: ABC transporter permease, partial [Oscillospiraceae bacterium]|nr:ABC transporter permease [Oscillospiraceae bacterium]